MLKPGSYVLILCHNKCSALMRSENRYMILNANFRK